MISQWWHDANMPSMCDSRIYIGIPMLVWNTKKPRGPWDTFLNKDLGPTSQFSIIVWFVSKSHFQKKIVNSSIIQVLYNSAAYPYLLALLFHTEGVDFSLFLANLLSLSSLDLGPSILHSFHTQHRNGNWVCVSMVFFLHFVVIYSFNSQNHT